MEKAKKFTDLIVWQKAHKFVLSAYRLSEKFPNSEIYGLISQFRRAAVSIPANIAEGFRKRSKAEKTYFLGVSQSSLEECRYYLILAKDLGYSDTKEQLIQLEEVSKILMGYSNAIRSDI
ncbi:MAG: four helix bundle protein [Phycisphaerae bacterium]|jgi:four helix bundle protein